MYFRGGGNRAHNIPFIGNAYIIELPLFLLGLSVLLTKKTPSSLLLLFWLGIAPIAQSVTKDAPHSARMLAVLPALQIVTAIGLASLLRKRWIAVGVFGLLLLSFMCYTDLYFVHFPKSNRADWGTGYNRLAQYLNDHKREYNDVVFARPQDSPYIFLAFYLAYDPNRIMTETARYPVTKDGFSHVAKFDNIEFRPPQYPADIRAPGRLVIDWTLDIPATISATRTAHEVKRLDGEPLFSILQSEISTAQQL